MENFSDDQFQHLLESLNQNSSNESYETFLGNLDEIPDIAFFNSFCDPSLVPMINDPESLLSFPPLPLIEEEEYTPPDALSPPSLSDNVSSANSTPVSVPEINEALETAHWAKYLVESQRSQQEAMKLELDAMRSTVEKIRTYQLEVLNPWVEDVHNALRGLGCLGDEPPASATDGEFDINIIDRP